MTLLQAQSLLCSADFKLSTHWVRAAWDSALCRKQSYLDVSAAADNEDFIKQIHLTAFPFLLGLPILHTSCCIF